MNYHALGFGDVGLAAGMMGVNIGLSVAFRLGLERSLLWASVRMTAQLLLVGYALEWIFSLRHPLLAAVLGAAFVVMGLVLLGILRISPWYQAQYVIPCWGWCSATP